MEAAPPLLFYFALSGAMVLVAAFPDVVVQALILGVPEVGPEVEAHLTEQLSEAAGQSGSIRGRFSD